MNQRQRYLDKKEIGRRGRDLYASKIKAQVEEGNEGRIVAIDVTTGNYEIGDTVLEAADPLFERHPKAQPWSTHVGSDAVYHLGVRSLKKIYDDRIY